MSCRLYKSLHRREREGGNGDAVRAYGSHKHKKTPLFISFLPLYFMVSSSLQPIDTDM